VVSPIRMAKYTVPDLQSAGFGSVVGEVGAVESTPVGAHVGGDGVALPVDEQAANDSPRTTTPKTLDCLVTDQIVGPYRPGILRRLAEESMEKVPLVRMGSATRWRAVDEIRQRWRCNPVAGPTRTNGRRAPASTRSNNGYSTGASRDGEVSMNVAWQSHPHRMPRPTACRGPRRSRADGPHPNGGPRGERFGDRPAYLATVSARCGSFQPGRTKWQVYPSGYLCR
jgi:hypothetical protein